MSDEQCFRSTARCTFDRAIRAAFSVAACHHGAEEAYARLLRHVRRQAHLLRPTGCAGPGRTGDLAALNYGLLNLALHHADWLRPAEAWVPPPANRLPQFASLARHLLTMYPVPAFMTSAWLGPPTAEARRQQGWFKHLGSGRSIRTADLPIPLTRAMAHWFGQAPAHFTVEAALRRAQVRGLGGPEELARAVVATRLGKEFRHEDFWLTALQFFVNHPRLDPAHVGPVVDFLHHRRHVPREVFVEGVLTKLGPPDPDYSMKGRTVPSLLRQVEAWHEELGKERSRPALAWSRSRIGEYELLEGTEELHNMRRWTIKELLTSLDLQTEGRALRHCVASYARECARRRTTIWSLRVQHEQGEKRVLTIEVDPKTRRISQVRGKANRLPTEKERLVLRGWAKQEGLKMR